jgi:hypothetical protein
MGVRAWKTAKIAIFAVREPALHKKSDVVSGSWRPNSLLGGTMEFFRLINEFCISEQSNNNGIGDGTPEVHPLAGDPDNHLV